MRRIVLTILAALGLPATGAAQDMVGRTALVVQDVEGTLAQQVRRLGVKDDVFLDETISTQPESASEIVFLDGTTLDVGPTSRVTLSKYVYDPRPSKQKLALDAIKGVFRFATGAFSKESYEINTPTATIGVRGTRLECYTDDSVTHCDVSEGMALITDKRTGETREVPAGQSLTIGNGDRDLLFTRLDSFRDLLSSHRAELISPFERRAQIATTVLTPFGNPQTGAAAVPVLTDGRIVVRLPDGSFVILPATITNRNVVSPNGLR